MHNIKNNFDNIFQTIQSLKLNCFDENRNIPKPGIPSLFPDLQVVSLALIAECMSLDSFEAVVYTTGKGMRLPTEFEWEVACRCHI